MVKSKIINVNGHKCKLTLVKGKIKENDLVISKHRFDEMDENGIYDPKTLKPFDVEIEQVILINIGSDSNPRIVLGFSDGGTCGDALKRMYSLVNVTIIN